MGELSQAVDEEDVETSGDDANFESFLAALAASPPPYRPPALAPGDLFAARYCIDRELGRGGMGTVYLALDRKLGRKVALKIARGRRAEVELARLQHEATIMAGLSHPGIVTVFEADVEGDDVYLALEFVPGGTLRDWLDVEVRPWREVVEMFATIAEGLAAAHSAEVVHRDFKPHNVLIDLQGRPRIADFGLARSRGAAETLDLPLLSSSGTLTVSGSVVGTPAYMAPEQAEGREATEASDQFSFFVSLYEALVGQRPYPGKTLQAILDAIDDGPPSRIPNAPRALAIAIRRGLMKDPSRRHRDMETVAHTLRRVLNARRRRARNLFVSLGAVAAMSLGFFSAPSDPDPCDPNALARPIDALWGEDARARVPERAAAAFDAHAADLTEQRIAACEGHEVARTLSDQDFALRSACLDRLEGRFDGLVTDALEHGAPEGLQSLLASPASCKDTERLRRLQNAFRGESVRDDAAQDEASRRAEEMRVKILLAQRRGEDTKEQLDALEEVARAHRLTDILASVYLLRAVASLDPDVEARLLEQAQSYGNESRNIDVMTKIAVQRAVVAIRNEHMDEASAFLDHAEALLGLATYVDTEAEALQIAMHRHEVDIAQRRLDEALSGLATLQTKLDADSPEALRVLTLIADARAQRGELLEAADAYRGALEHPLARDPGQRLGLLLNRGFILEAANQPAQALPLFEQASGVLGDPEALPAEYRGYIAIGRTRGHRLQGALERAQDFAERARSLFEDTDPEHAVLPDVYDELSAIAEARGDAALALRHAEQAARRYDATRGPGSDAAALSAVRAARALHDLGRDADAKARAEAALTALRAKDRVADELAVARLALAEASGQDDADARATCEASIHAICREALVQPAQTALSP